MYSGKENFLVQKWVTVLSVVLFILKITAYYLTDSLAILSDAMESIVNIVAGFIGLYSLYIAAQPRDENHPYGHGKAEFISAAAEGSLIIAAGILIIYETIVNTLENHRVQALDNGMWLVGSTAILNYIAGAVCIRIGRKNNSLALESSGKHLQIDTYSTVGVLAAIAQTQAIVNRQQAEGTEVLIEDEVTPPAAEPAGRGTCARTGRALAGRRW